MQKCEISAREVRDRALSEEKGLAMGRRDVRLESLRKMEPKEGVLVTQIKVVKSLLEFSALVIFSMVFVVLVLFSLPVEATRVGVWRWLCFIETTLREWGFGSVDSGFRDNLISIILAIVPMELAIYGTTWVAGERKKGEGRHVGWLQDVVDNEKRELVASLLLYVSGYVCGMALLGFWGDVLLKCQPGADVVVASFLSAAYVFAATIPALMKVRSTISISGYSRNLLLLRRIAKWRYYHEVSPRCGCYGVVSRGEKSRNRWRVRLSLAFIAVMSGLPAVSLWWSLTVHGRGRTELPGHVSISMILLGWGVLWGGVVVVVNASEFWVKVRGLGVEPTWRWHSGLAAVVIAYFGGAMQSRGYYSFFGNWWLASLSVVGANIIPVVLVWRTLRDEREFSLYPFVLERVTVVQRGVAEGLVDLFANGGDDREKYLAVANLIVPDKLVLDGNDLSLRDFVNEMMAFDDAYVGILPSNRCGHQSGMTSGGDDLGGCDAPGARGARDSGPHAASII